MAGLSSDLVAYLARSSAKSLAARSADPQLSPDEFKRLLRLLDAAGAFLQAASNRERELMGLAMNDPEAAQISAEEQLAVFEDLKARRIV